MGGGSRVEEGGGGRMGAATWVGAGVAGCASRSAFHNSVRDTLQPLAHHDRYSHLLIITTTATCSS